MATQTTTWLKKTIEKFFADWPFKPEVVITEEDQAIVAQINTGKDFVFTQPNAQPLLALQHLLRLMFKKQFPDYPKKLLIDMGNFRQQQLDAIIKVVQEAIWQAKASGNSVHLSPMSSFERRLVHMNVAAEPDLISESIGGGLDRHVVIKLSAK